MAILIAEHSPAQIKLAAAAARQDRRPVADATLILPLRLLTMTHRLLTLSALR